MKKLKIVVLILSLITSLSASNIKINDNTICIPIGGNSWVVENNFNDNNCISDEGIINWKKSESKFRIYFKLMSKGEISVSLNLKVISGESKIKCSLNGQTKTVLVNNTNFSNQFVGIYKIAKPGYHYIELEGLKKQAEEFANIKELLISGNATKGTTYFVKDDFYWGRRGPSVHLSYKIPQKAGDIEWFYNEIKIPEGNDVVGSYFMANGFKEGYFGFQVNSENERRILFSVWSPYKTQNPNEIPEDYRITLLKKGNDVYSGKFGNEGSGGQSYFRYNWKAGVNYKFLLQGKPAGNNKTIYTAYFYIPELEEWKLIASFERPYTNTYLKRFHSFLENFIPSAGNITREGLYTNQWIKTSKGNWYELTEAKFTADATARKEARMDYAGGSKDSNFYMKNCGFFNETTKIGSWVKRKPTNIKPIIDFSKLP